MPPHPTGGSHPQDARGDEAEMCGPRATWRQVRRCVYIVCGFVCSIQARGRCRGTLSCERRQSRLLWKTEESAGAGDGLRGEEAEDPEHGQAAVVDLGAEAALLGLGGHVLVEAEGVVEGAEEEGVGTASKAGYFPGTPPLQ